MGNKEESSSFTTDAAPRVLFVAHTSQLNGADRSLLSLVTELVRKKRIEPMVALPRRGPLFQQFQAEGIQTLVCPAVRWVGKGFRPLHAVVSAVTILACLLRSLPAIRRFKPDIIYSNTSATGFGVAIALSLGKPHILHIREFLEEDFGMRFVFGRGITIRLASRVTKHVICNSKAVANKYRPHFSNIPVTVVYNGFRCSEMEGQGKKDTDITKPKPFRLLFAGVLAEGKNQLEAIEALYLIRNKGLDAHLYIAGTGKTSYVRLLKSRRSELGLDECVHFLGFVQDLATEYMAADAVLICSRSEAFGRVLIEAMCFGAPVVAGASGAMPELITHRETGLLYELGNPESLAENVRILLQSPGLNNNISQKAKNRVREDFNLEKYSNGVFDVMTTSLKPGSRSKTY